MKLRKITSLVVTVAIAMSTAVISLPNAFAADGDEETYTFTETFDGMEVTDTADPESKKATMDALIGKGWYPVENRRAYTSIDTSQEMFQFATVVSDEDDASNHYLRLDTPTIKTNPEKYGIGRSFPGPENLAKNVSGVWEIDFKFKAYADLANGIPAQFNFGLNTLDPNREIVADDAKAQHNIVSAYNNKLYFGHYDYRAINGGIEETNEAGQVVKRDIPQGTIESKYLNFKWYDVKVIVNCDAKYYSVELSQGGVVRRGAISFAGNEPIGFFKMSALGVNKPATVFVDDIKITKLSEPETLIYKEDFQSKTNGSAAIPMTTGGEKEDLDGDCYFGLHTPWRGHKSIGNKYGIFPEDETDPENDNKVVRLGGEKPEEGVGIGSGLVYMPVLQELATDATQPNRGRVKTSFRIKPETVGESGVKVNAIGAYTQDITADNSVAFEIANNEEKFKIMNGEDAKAELAPSTWYDVELVFDVIEGTVATKVKSDDGEEIASFSKELETIKDVNALKGIMFNVPVGSDIYADDIVIEYVPYAPKPSIGKIQIRDRFGNTKQVKENEPVTAALQAIFIPFGCELDPETANDKTITLTNDGTDVKYTPEIRDNGYILNLTGLLKWNAEYTLTVPETVANKYGDKLGERKTYPFKTTDDRSDLMTISSVKVGDKAVEKISDITAGSTVNVAVKYANSSGDYIIGTAVLVFRKEGEIVEILTKGLNAAIAGGAVGTDDSSFAFKVPEDLNMEEIDDVSVFLWEDFDYNTPYCPKVSFTK